MAIYAAFALAGYSSQWEKNGQIPEIGQTCQVSAEHA